MITLMTIPAFKGTNIDYMKSLAITLSLVPYF